MSSKAMQCETVRAQLAAGSGDAGSDAAVAAHLERCDACRAYAEDCGALARTGRSLGQHCRSAATEATALRLSRLGRARALESRPLWRSLPQWGLPVISASVSAAAVILLLGLPRSGTPTPAAGTSAVATAPGPAAPDGDRAPARRGDMARLSRLLVVSSSYAADTAIPGDLAVLGNWALAPVLRGSTGVGARTASGDAGPSTHRQSGGTL